MQIKWLERVWEEVDVSAIKKANAVGTGYVYTTGAPCFDKVIIL